MFFLHYYPLSYREHITKYASEFGLESSLVASVINAESSFRPSSVSNSNAIGLMQLKFTTAEEISVKLKEREFKEEHLFNPEQNIKYGCYYLRYLINYYNGNIINALCAYNAGLSNVNNWLKSEDYSKDGINLTHIPFKETSDYINKIKYFKKIYKHFYRL